jgi:hypothetical protein
MFITLIIISLLAFSGFALTYLFADEETFLWRLAAGNIIGAAAFGTIGFLIACLAGLSAATVLAALVISALPLALFAKKDFQKKFRRDWASAKGKLQGANFRRTLGFSYYAFFFILFWFFFERAMFETAEGIFTGGSQNLGDLPFHLGAIYSFTEGGNFPPENPSYANAKFSYPFIADFLTASLMKLGAGLQSAMHLQNVSWAFSLLVILERFVYRFTGSRLASRFAPPMLFFSGGFGFLWFLNDFREQAKGFFEFLYALPHDYTIGKFRWGNSLVTLFLTQRSLLLGMPLTLIVLKKLWEIFVRDEERETDGESESEKEKKRKNKKAFRSSAESPAGTKGLFSISHFPFSIFLIGLLAGTLPLGHLHSLLVLFAVGVFLLVWQTEKWREWIAFGVGVSLIAVPELVWATAGSATDAKQFIALHFGWDKGETNFLWFWINNTGIFFPVLLFGFYLAYKKIRFDEPETKKKTPPAVLDARQLAFYIPFLFCFVVSNVMKLAPWQWDNIKVLIYWYVASLGFAAPALVWIYRRRNWGAPLAAACLAVLMFSGALDVWRTVSKQINYNVFNADAVRVAEGIKRTTAPDALFANAPTYNSPVVLSGRRSLMRFTGHLSSYGIDYSEREADLKRIYAGDATAGILLKKYGIEYIIVTPEERRWTQVNEDFLDKLKLVTQAGENKVYKVN